MNYVLIFVYYLGSRDSDAMPPNQLIVDLAVYVLKYNYFSFDNDFYLQVFGTSVCSIFAPNYVNLFMGHLEKNVAFKPPVNSLYTNGWHILHFQRQR